MIEINDDYSISSDRHNWILHERRIDAPSKRFPRGRNTVHKLFYPDLQKLGIAYVQRSAKDAGSVDAILAAIDKAASEITGAISYARQLGEIE